MEKVQKCEVQEQSYVPSPESFKVYLYSSLRNEFRTYSDGSSHPEWNEACSEPSWINISMESTDLIILGCHGYRLLLMIQLGSLRHANVVVWLGQNPEVGGTMCLRNVDNTVNIDKTSVHQGHTASPRHVGDRDLLWLTYFCTELHECFNTYCVVHRHANCFRACFVVAVVASVAYSVDIDTEDSRNSTAMNISAQNVLMSLPVLQSPLLGK
jgi:hypothetical protein